MQKRKKFGTCSKLSIDSTSRSVSCIEDRIACLKSRLNVSFLRTHSVSFSCKFCEINFLVCVNVQKVVKTMNPAQNFIILVPNVSLIEKTQILKFFKVFSLGKIMGFWAGFTILNTFCTSVYIFDTP